MCDVNMTDMRDQTAIHQLEAPISQLEDDTVDYMIVHSRVGGYRVVIWKDGYNCYYCFRSDFFRVNNRYEWRLKTEISRRDARHRIRTKTWKVLAVGVFRTHIMRTSHIGSILVPENFSQYQSTYYQMIKIRNFHNQMDRIFWEFSIHALCPSICTTVLQEWFHTILHKHRMRNVILELHLLPPLSNTSVFPGGIEYQQSLLSFQSSIGMDDDDEDAS